MENTGKVLFGAETTPQWFVAVGEQTVGPMTAGEVYDRIRAGELTWVHYVWRNGQADWVRACDSPTFQPAMPRAPKGKPASPPAPPRTPAAPAVPEVRNWFLYYNDTQFGPFSVQEVTRYLSTGKVHGRVHAWKDGMGGWVRLEEIGDFGEAVAEGKRLRQEREKARESFELDSGGEQAAAEKRKAPRFPLLARLLVADTSQVTVALCRDISVGGMQVLTDRIPGPVGTRLKLNVSPASSGASSKKKAAIAAFVAEGEIVRILEDGRGYSFRFKKLPEKSRQAIETYIRESEE
jgi:hypothetical protein